MLPASINIQKARFFTKKILKLFLWSRYGTGHGTGAVTCQQSEPGRNRNTVNNLSSGILT
jgi:hypothetical protein